MFKLRMSIFLVMVATLAVAQEKNPATPATPQLQQSKLSVALIMGATIGLFNDDYGFGLLEDFKRTPRTGLNLGLRLRYPISKSFNLRLDPMFTGKGGAYRTVAEDVTVISNDPSYDKEYYYANYRISYLQAAILGEVDLTGADKFFLSFGPAFALRTGSAFRYNEFVPTGKTTSQGYLELKNVYKTDELNGTNPYSMSLVVELTYDFRNGSAKNPIVFSVRYDGSLTPTFESSILPNSDTRMTTWSINMGYVLK